MYDDDSHVTSEKELAPMCSLLQTRQVDCLQTKKRRDYGIRREEGGISEEQEELLYQAAFYKSLGENKS